MCLANSLHIFYMRFIGCLDLNIRNCNVAWRSKMINEPLISVIIPVYKVESYLETCMESVLGQTYTNLEIILVDDGSPDKCPILCDEYAKKDERVLVIHKQNGGLASARNAGLDIASGQLVSFIDSDDWIENETYEKVIHLYKKTSAEIIMFDIIKTDGTVFFDRYNLTKKFDATVEAEEVVKDILLDKVGSEVVKAVYDIACWHNVRFPQGRLYEDIPTTYRAFENAKRVAIIDEALYKYRVNKESISYTPNPLKAYHFYLGFRDHFEYARRYYPEIIKGTSANAAHYAITMYFHACSDAKRELFPYRCEVEQFLLDNKACFDIKGVMRSRRVMLHLFYFSKSIFELMSLILNKTGIQKYLNLEVK